MSDLTYVGDCIKGLTKAVKTQDNHVLSDLDTYQVTTALTEIRDELKRTNTLLGDIRNILEVK